MKFGLEINEFDWSGGPLTWAGTWPPSVADSDAIERFGSEVIAATR